MSSKIINHKNYTEFREVYQLKLPLELDGLVPDNDSVRLLSRILEELNYDKLYQAYSAKGRNPAVDPKTMFKILVYAYSQDLYSTHQIENACRRDINFMWLLAGQKAPDHSTIARFRQKYLSECMEDLFYQFIQKLHEICEIPLKNVFIDGTKIEANANKYTFVWKKVICKNESKMHLKVQKLFTSVCQSYLTDCSFDKKSPLDSMTKLKDFLELKKQEEGIEFVHGIGKRKTQLQRWYDTLLKYIIRQKSYDYSNKQLDNRNSYSKTDPDATFMHMKEDHMRNSQLKPGYNVQIGVESEYIVGVGIFQNRTDYGTLIPMLQKMEVGIGNRYQSVTTDSGYESEYNYVWLELHKIKPFIKPQTYELWKKKSFKKDISKRENMTYIEEGDIYICANGRCLYPSGIRHTKTESGYISEQTFYKCEDCSGCPYAQKCKKSISEKVMRVSKKLVEKREKSYKNITSEYGTKLRMNRSIQVEGAFGVLKYDHEFNRFLTRGKNNVKTEFILLSLGYNINKLHAKIQGERCGSHLHELKKSA